MCTIPDDIKIYCNLIGMLRSWRIDEKWYRQSPRPSLCVFNLNDAKGAVWLARLFGWWGKYLGKVKRCVQNVHKHGLHK